MKIVIKLGGSLIDYAPDIIKNIQKIKKHTIVIVPGGGIFANVIRDIAKKYKISEIKAHSMAILSMEQYGLYLLDKTDANRIESLDDAKIGVSILLPYNLLKDNDELIPSWDTTSDTISAWIAYKFGAKFIKVTSVDGVFDKDDTLIKKIDSIELLKMGTTCADLALPKFLSKRKMSCLIVNGKQIDRVINAIYGNAVIGTYVSGI
ncbi:MAG: amino acid kinase [Methanosarcinaceae archaeon]|nr:amino acid kinase [Methanosarcinaceae archaeon]NKQ38796.1 amino acid kinase [Methanosarcinales archaeon]